MPNTCDRCVHWRRQEGKYDDPLFGTCVSDHFEYESPSAKTSRPTSLIYWDYEGYSAGFATGEKFGCIHFKGNDDAKAKPQQR
jgi:hypothetical protein